MENLEDTVNSSTDNKANQTNAKKKDNDNDRDPYYASDSDNDF